MSSVVATFSAGESALSSNGLLGLLKIFELDCQIAVVQRAPVSAIDAYLAATSHQMGKGFRISLCPGDSLPLNLLPPYRGRDAFAADILYLAEAYGDLLGCPAIGLRLEVISHAMCPRFHVDHNGIRLLCTYRGFGTEWLSDADVDHSKLGPRSSSVRDEDSGIIINADGIQRVAPYAIALLKGSMWQGNSGKGIIHRSPTVAANTAPRVLLALDALW